MSTAVADDKQDVYDTGRGVCRDAGHVQVDHHTARAVGIDRVGACFLPFRREFGRDAVADVITLCEIAVAVKNLDTCPTCGGPFGIPPGVYAVTPNEYSPLSV